MYLLDPDIFAGGRGNIVRSLSPAAWFRFNRGITQAGGFASQWDDQSGNARHLKQPTGTNQPAVNPDGSLLFDGVDNFMKCDAFTLVQPETIYLLMKQVTWTINDRFCDGDTAVPASMLVYQSTSTPNITMFAGSATADNANLGINTYAAICAVFNGASSVLRVGNTTEVTGNAGASNGGGFTLGAQSNPGAYSNIEVKEAIIFPTAHTPAQRAQVVAYLLTL